MIRKGITALAALMLLGACATNPEPRGTGDLGVVIERATGSVKWSSTATIPCLGGSAISATSAMPPSSFRAMSVTPMCSAATAG